jgi:hypothetical protein
MLGRWGSYVAIGVLLVPFLVVAFVEVGPAWSVLRIIPLALVFVFGYAWGRLGAERRFRESGKLPPSGAADD